MTPVINVQFVSFFAGCPSASHSIDDWPKRLDKIIDQIERVGSRSVMNTKGREQAGCCTGSSERCPDNSIAVIQQAIAPVLVMAAKAFKQTLPIGAGRLRFQIVGVA